MDPDVTLDEIRRLISKYENGENLSIYNAETVMNLFTDLDNWLSKGGMKPADWSATRIA